MPRAAPAQVHRPVHLQALRNQLNSQRQREAERALESTELLAENSDNLPAGIVDQFKVNRELSAPDPYAAPADSVQQRAHG